MDFDVYGRLVAMITVDEKNISEELVGSGLAWVHIYFCNEPICTAWQSLQERAMSRRIGTLERSSSNRALAVEKETLPIIKFIIY